MSSNHTNNISDDQALEALLSSAQSNQDAKNDAYGRGHGYRRDGKRENRGEGKNDDDFVRHHYSSYNGDQKRRYVGDDLSPNRGKNDDYQRPARPQGKRQRRWNQRDEGKDDSKYKWGGAASNSSNSKSDRGGGYYGPAPASSTGDNQEESKSDTKTPKEKPNFGLSGALAEDEKTGNTFNGIVLKFTEPPEARTPNTRWRLYVFKKKKNNNEDDGGVIQTLHLSKQSAYLFGRERKVADVPVDHPSLSKQHCVLQYRALPDKQDRERKLKCKPYLMDLGSTNGTFINGERIDDARYYELRKGDVITLGASSREYVLLTENTISSDLG